MMNIGRRGALSGAGAALAAPAVVHAQGTTGVALLIGNSKYDWEASLPNVKRDVTDVARRFEAMGLKTEVLENLRLDAMNKALAKLTEASRGASVAAVYFAGHGVYWEGKNYLVPVDSDLGNPAAAKTTLVSNFALNLAVKPAGARLIVFDSCRNNPADGWRQRHARLSAGVPAADAASFLKDWPNTIILFSTVAGGVALDGPAGQNSPFAAALLRRLAATSIDLQSLSTNMRRDLLLATGGQQLMIDYTGAWARPVVLNAPGKSAPAAAASYDPSKVVELSNAYAYAQKNNLFLPQGLIAYRATDPADAHKAGAFAVDFQGFPHLVIVTAVPDSNSAAIVWASHYVGSAVAKGAFYRPITTSRAGNTLKWTNYSEEVHYEFKWSDKDSGFFSISNAGTATAGAAAGTRRFTRLDG